MASDTTSARSGLRVPFLRTLSPVGKTLVAVGAYVVWTALTWVLEGRIQTLLRPDAVADRLVYTGLTNVVVGTVLALFLVREFVAAGFTTRSALGFRSASHTAVAVVVAGLLGVGLYVLQGPPTTDPVVLGNVFAQVLPVSIAEVVVCWVVVGGSVAALLRQRGLTPSLADGSALVVSAVLFGVYHLAHSPPFNSAEMVGVLTVVGVGTGLIYFGGGSFYAALVFHNLMALFGVVTSLATAGHLGTYQQPLGPVLVTGIVALAVLVGTERLLVESSSSHSSAASTV